MGERNHREPGRMSLAVKMNLVTTGMILLVAGGLLLISYFVQARRIDAIYRERVETAARTAAGMAESDLLKGLWEAVNTEEFREVYGHAQQEQDETIIRQWMELQPSSSYFVLSEEGEKVQEYYSSLAYDYDLLFEALATTRNCSGVTDVYLQFDKDGVTYNLVDPEEDMLHIMTVEEEVPAFAPMEDNGSFPATVYRSKYGWLCTACETVKDPWSGEVAGVACADMDMNTVMQTRLAFLVNSILFVAMLTLICILLNLFLLHRIAVEPLRKLTDAACGFAKTEKKYTKDDVIDVDIRSNDEIGDLYHEIRDMQTRIVDYTDRMTEFAAAEARTGTGMELANRIQMSMLPDVTDAFPDRKEFSVSASMRPAKEVGGDFYNCFLTDDSHLCLMMADVSGKGVPAALFMMASMILIRDLAMSGAGPAEILEKANGEICRNNRAKMFVTVWLGILDLATGVMTCANAGHEFPVLRGKDGIFRLFKDKHSFVVGGMEDMKYKNYEITLEPGDAIFVYTDGVPEANDADGNFFGTDRMEEALNSAGTGHPGEVLRKVSESVEAFAGGAEQFDDMTMMCLEYQTGDDSHLKRAER